MKTKQQQYRLPRGTCVAPGGTWALRSVGSSNPIAAWGSFDAVELGGSGTPWLSACRWFVSRLGLSARPARLCWRGVAGAGPSWLLPHRCACGSASACSRVAFLVERRASCMHFAFCLLALGLEKRALSGEALFYSGFGGAGDLAVENTWELPEFAVSNSGTAFTPGLSISL